MLFNSYIFLIFLPVVWIGYFGLNQVRLFKVARFMLIIEIGRASCRERVFRAV